MSTYDIICTEAGCMKDATHIDVGGARSDIHLCDDHYSAYVKETNEILKTFTDAGI